MAYYIDLFSPETYEAFSKSDRTISGFRIRHRNLANKVNIGDKLICYLTRLSRWIGVLEVTSKPFIDDSPRFYEANDPFVVRFKVKPLVWLEVEKALPIHEPEIWKGLSFTRDLPPSSNAWTGKVRRCYWSWMTKTVSSWKPSLSGNQGLPPGGCSHTTSKPAKKYLLHKSELKIKTYLYLIPTDEDSEDKETITEQCDVNESIRFKPYWRNHWR